MLYLSLIINKLFEYTPMINNLNKQKKNVVIIPIAFKVIN